MAKATKRTIQAMRVATVAYAKAQAAIYSAVSGNNVPWSECYAAASHDTRRKYGEAQDKLMQVEADAIAKGQAWRSSFGVVYLNGA